jgi:glycosyltransferase involved in cell wall biosynthesis
MARALAQAGARVFVASPSAVSEFEGLTLSHVMPEPPKDANPQGTSPLTWGVRQWGRELLRWPDPDAAWCRRLTEACIAQVPFTPDWVITSSPPESLLSSGLRLKQHFGCRWLADFRDCWLDPPRRMERKLFFRRVGEAMMARHLITRADVVTAVDQKVADEMARLGKVTAHVVPQLLPERQPGRPLSPADDIHLVYTGQISIGDPDRHAATLLDVFEAARARNPRLRLHVAGHLTLAETAAFKATPSAGMITFHGALPLRQTLELQASADGLVVLSSPNGWAVPGKVAEYKAAGAPIVAIGSGPWRQSAQLPIDNDPIHDMASLSKRDCTKPSPPPADPGRERFLALLGMSPAVTGED